MKVILPNPNDENALEVVQIDEWDTWSMDHTLSLLIVPMLKQLKDQSGVSGYPATLNTMEEWYEVLDKMIWSFEQSQNLYDITLDSKVDYKATMDKIQEGFDLFGKYYMGLWD